MRRFRFDRQSVEITLRMYRLTLGTNRFLKFDQCTNHLWNARKPASHSYGYGVPMTEWPTDGVIARSWSSADDRPPHGKASVC
ncbi:hypothetical protein CEXT_238961 [Caerostris extrusa]|uniref:Uncharacterized protein n=1 Tax=Caerostris extrusa TaxID=172846 RepID=A0AAV4RBE3_CAEEX|nr:hypothetical protein CEXT_238961 [Caerostris extrusa]